jgi:hypothetical protein
VQRALRVEAERNDLTKDLLVRKVHEVLLEGRPFERLKAAELLAKLAGWFASSELGQRPLLPIDEGPENYAALVETLRRSGDLFTPRERASIRQSLRQVIAEVTTALDLLDCRSDEDPLVPTVALATRACRGGEHSREE